MSKEQVLVVKNNKYSFEDRAKMEIDPSYRQIIPYIVLHREYKIALWRRNNTNEQRLKNRYTIGIGGHINPKDASNGMSVALIQAIAREISEEVNISGVITKICYTGRIKLDTAPVDKVHLGISYDVFLSEDTEVTSNSDELIFEGWFAPKEIKPYIKQQKGILENWSKAVL